MDEGNHPPRPEVKPIKASGMEAKDMIDVAKLILYFRISKTFFRASVAMSGVTLMYAYRERFVGDNA